MTESLEERLLFPINSLLQMEEQEFLDFKREHYCSKQENPISYVDFVHDVLCLANAEHHGDRYIIFGVENNTKKIIGVENDPKRKKLQDYINVLRASNFNNLPTITLLTFSIDEHELDVIIIRDKKKRPYFLLKDKEAKDKKNGKVKIVRAGVIYTRDGDCNTQVDSTAEPLKINNMWREHFGLDLIPLERFKIYIQEHDMWLRQPKSNDKSMYYHKLFPEFTIECCNDEDNSKWEPSWYKYKPVISEHIKLFYFNTVLYKADFDLLDKENCFFPYLWSSSLYVSQIFPKKRDELDTARYYYENEFYFALKDDLSYELYNLFRKIYNYKTIEEFANSHWAKMPIYVFDNLGEAKAKIKELGVGKIGVPEN